MTKKEAISQLITDFQNRLIERGIEKYDDIDLDLDKDMAEALKIKFN